jgi:hypothetical protein
MPRKRRAITVAEDHAPYGDAAEIRLKHTGYFLHTRLRPDRAAIREEWILRTVTSPLYSAVQSDGRIRRWAWIDEPRKYLRVILLADGVTVHNVFFDRSFKPPAP